MENNNLEIIDGVKEVAVSQDVVNTSSSNTIKVIAGLGVGIALGTIFYKKVLVPKLEAKLGMPEADVLSARDTEE